MKSGNILLYYINPSRLRLFEEPCFALLHQGKSHVHRMYSRKEMD